MNSDLGYISSATSATDGSMEALNSDSNNVDGGVGLSNPRLSQSRRRMLDLVNKLHSTGCVFFLRSQVILVG